jgi:hypothetical protein
LIFMFIFLFSTFETASFCPPPTEVW